jgi:carboxymethylenebutenolidase
MKGKEYAILGVAGLVAVIALGLSLTITGSNPKGDINGNAGGAIMKQNSLKNAGGNPGPGEPGHVGCQEGEIDEYGNCAPAKDNNAGLFGQDLDPYVEYVEVNGTAKGFLAKPREAGDYPGIVMIHEWWGLNDNIREMAKILAKDGYVVFAVDLYGGEVANDSARAGQLAGRVRDNPQKAVQEMKNAVEYLRGKENARKIGSLGWCFGGGQSLQLALNENIDATVIYYGQLVSDREQLKNIRWPVLGFFGGKDTSIPASSIEAFRAALDGLGVENSVYVYPGVGHAFANPSGANYAKNETIDSWGKTVTFLDKNLKHA